MRANCPSCCNDIPGRTGTPIQPETLIALAAHERIVAVKDAKGDLTASGRVMAETDLAYYSGDDAITLPLLSIGGVGVIGTSTHFSGAGTMAMIDAYESGDIAEARRRHRALLPIYTGIFRTQGTILVKAGLPCEGDRSVRLGPPRRCDGAGDRATRRGSRRGWALARAPNRGRRQTASRSGNRGRSEAHPGRRHRRKLPGHRRVQR